MVQRTPSQRLESRLSGSTNLPETPRSPSEKKGALGPWGRLTKEKTFESQLQKLPLNVEDVWQVNENDTKENLSYLTIHFGGKQFQANIMLKPTVQECPSLQVLYAIIAGFKNLGIVYILVSVYY